jgi:hypothetical protein
MTGRPARVEQRPPWAMIVGVSLIALLAVVIILALLVSSPPTDASSSPTPSASPNPTVSLSASPAATPQPTATEVAEPSAPELPQGMLPPGAVITVSVDFVRIRSAPSLAARVVDRMVRGDAAYVENRIDAGPVLADGFAWYRVAYAGGRDVWPFQDVFPGGYEIGWMAAGDDTQPYVEPIKVTCPAAPVTLSMLANELTPWERLVCLGGKTVTLKGRYGCDGCGGVTPGATPEWLADAAQAEVIAARGGLYPAVHFAVPPDADVPKVGDLVRLTVLVDDPVAETCAYHPPSDTEGGAFDYDPAAVLLYCRELLVLESVTVIGHDSFPS